MSEPQGIQINICFWGDVANTVTDFKDHPVVAIKGVKVSEFGGWSLNYVDQSSLFINPNLGIAKWLRVWYDSLASKWDIKTVTFDPAKKCLETKSAQELMILDSKILIQNILEKLPDKKIYL